MDYLIQKLIGFSSTRLESIPSSKPHTCIVAWPPDLGGVNNRNTLLQKVSNPQKLYPESLSFRLHLINEFKTLK
jgi:hypothetical protein